MEAGAAQVAWQPKSLARFFLSVFFNAVKQIVFLHHNAGVGGEMKIYSDETSHKHINHFKD